MSSEPKLKPIRGHLPIPRDIFPKREGDVKVQPGYVDKIYPVAKSEAQGLAPKSEEEARHRLMAEARRKSLAAGLQGLWDRKQERIRKIEARRTQAAKINRKLALAPNPLSETLTQPSVRLSTGSWSAQVVQLDPERLEKAKLAKARHAEIQARKSEERRDALGHLYLAAKNFIVDEAELQELVDRTFTEEAYKSGVFKAQSIWYTNNAPIGVKDLLNEQVNHTMTNLPTAKRAVQNTASERQKLAAEALAGGKLDT